MSSSRVIDPVHGADPWKARARCSVISQASLMTRVCVGRSPGILVQNSASVSRWQSADRRRHAGTTEISAAMKLHLTSTRTKKTVEPLRIDVPVANLNYSYRSAISAEEVASGSESVSSGNGSSRHECGLNPARARIGVVITMANNVGNTPSTLSFCIDVRGKAGENRFADVHELRLLYLVEGLIDEAVKVVASGANHVLITRGIEKTTKALVSELKNMSKEVEDSELADVAIVSAGNNYEVGNMIVEAMSKVGRKGIVTLEEGKTSESNLRVVEGMQSDRGYISSYFVTDGEKMVDEKSWWGAFFFDSSLFVGDLWCNGLPSSGGDW
nr:chaperonin 60 subunit beta 3, chloroplastic [Ipomoea batatas]GME04400.1 chaperonin 60 subunit beta 3, chloroplastic [Ipomoea batatas]GME21722.1 chaperonin 60 subunit beta 3, chloroplastic [Ipomoea batatas]